MGEDIDFIALYTIAHSEAGKIFRKMSELKLHGLGPFYIINGEDGEQRLFMYLDREPMYANPEMPKIGYKILDYSEINVERGCSMELSTEVIIALFAFVDEFNDRAETIKSTILDICKN